MCRHYHILAAAIIVFGPFRLTSQEVSCSCEDAFAEMTGMVETNYIGLAFIRRDGHTEAYEERETLYRKKSVQAPMEECTKLMREFLRFFDDGHLFVFERPEYSKDELEVYRKNIQESSLDTNQIIEILRRQQSEVQTSHLDGMIGEWTDGKSRLAIISENEKYLVYILSSTEEGVEPGQIKAEFEPMDHRFGGTYYSYQYAPRYIEGGLYKESTLLSMDGGLLWAKTESKSEREIQATDPPNPSLPIIKALDEKTTLFSIPTFMTPYQDFVGILKENEDLLQNTTNLIIDIRGNTGGNAIYFAFIDLYANRTMKGGQGRVFASEATLRYFERFAQNAPDVYGPVAERIRANPGEIVDGPDYPSRTFESYETAIRNVAILTDDACMSAAESFIIHSRSASDKVTVFGSATAGVIDYTSVNSLKLECGSRNIYFGYPTSTLHKDIPDDGYNDTGILPDVPIDPTVHDKVQWIADYLRDRK